MKIRRTDLAGLYVVDIEHLDDERGFFARSFCRDEFAREGLVADIAQCSISFNRTKGTLRGMHYQEAPHAETKLVRCTRGAIFDVALDLRPDSPTFRKWFAAELTDTNRHALYVPQGFAHGFQTLTDDSEVFYQITPAYVPAAARGVRWNDPAFAISWPLDHPILSPRDAAYPDFGA